MRFLGVNGVIWSNSGLYCVIGVYRGFGRNEVVVERPVRHQPPMGSTVDAYHLNNLL